MTNLKIVFGSTKFDSSVDLLLLDQRHTDVCVERKNTIEIDFPADAHWTRVKNLKLAIRTADCLPILAFSSSSETIAAIHAGWRGIASGIAPKTLLSIQETVGHPILDWEIHIGPHLQYESFEFSAVEGLKMIEQALKHSSARRKPEDFYVQQDTNKIRIHLGALVALQLQPFYSKLRISPIDTKNDTNYFSYRRNPNSTGRQLSYIEIVS